MVSGGGTGRPLDPIVFCNSSQPCTSTFRLQFNHPFLISISLSLPKMAHRGRGHLHDAHESANHITELQLQDTELSASSSKAKGPNEKFTVEPHAVDQQKHELGNAGPLFSIRKMGRSFANTVRSHVPAVMRTTSQANLAAEDRDLAHGLKGNAKQPNVKHSNKSWGSRQLSKLRNLFVSSSNERDLSSVESERTESSTSAPGSSVNLTSTTTHCVACGNDNNVEDIGRALCGHVYCRDCLQNLVKTAIADEAFFPPRCCRQPIPFGIIQTLLTSDLVLTYINKHVEFKTPNRTYCYVQTCSTFIGSGNIVDNVGTCRECHSKTCTICKAAAHDRGECPKDPALQEILKMMGDNGWQRCKSCSSVVELKHGCNHITYVSHHPQTANANIIVAVAVVLIFATSVDCHGGPAPVRNGTNVDFLIMQTWL